jgi:hypothetical protein
LKAWQVFGGINVMWTLGFMAPGRRQYWKTLISSLLKNPRSVPIFIELAVFGYHFRKVAGRYTRSLLITGTSNPAA